jgi:endonuclease/exonuclease/phosphatase (EEP) superfamily protein YafD
MGARQQERRFPFGRPRVLTTAVALAILVYAAATLTVRALLLPNNLALLVAVSSAYAPLVALTGLILSLVARRIVLSFVAVLVLVVSLAVQLSWYYIGHPTEIGQYAEIRVLSSNLRKGQVDPSVFVPLAKANADVITVSELTPEEVQRFAQAGIEDAFPYSLLVPAPGAGGIGLWSRYPVTSVTQYMSSSIAAVRLNIPGVRFNPLLASVHIMSPVASDEDTFDGWHSGIAAVHAALADFAKATEPGAVIVGGDFNSTPDMRQFRDLATNGYQDAGHQIGAGFAPTFPVHRWFPPFITIDHVLTRNAAAVALRSLTMSGSDHRSLLATVRIPLDLTIS